MEAILNQESQNNQAELVLSVYGNEILRGLYTPLRIEKERTEELVKLCKKLSQSTETMTGEKHYFVSYQCYEEVDVYSKGIRFDEESEDASGIVTDAMGMPRIRGGNPGWGVRYTGIALQILSESDAKRFLQSQFETNLDEETFQKHLSDKMLADNPTEELFETPSKDFRADSFVLYEIKEMGPAFAKLLETFKTRLHAEWDNKAWKYPENKEAAETILACFE